MKFLIVLCLFGVTENGLAAVKQRSETVVVYGAATYHLIGTHRSDTEYFRNRWSKDGRLIGSPVHAIEHYWFDSEGYSSWKVFGGQNSVGAGIGGAAMSTGFNGDKSRLGMVLGLYSTDLSMLARETGKNVPGWAISRNFLIQPLFGPEWMYGRAVKIHLVITPALAMSYLSFGF